MRPSKISCFRQALQRAHGRNARLEPEEVEATGEDAVRDYRVLELWLYKVCELVTSEWQLGELWALSRYGRVAPLLEPQQVGKLLNYLRKRAVVMGSLPKVNYFPDPDDNSIIAATLAGRVSYLVSGDKGNLLALGTVQGVRIVIARAFVALVG